MFTLIFIGVMVGTLGAVTIVGAIVNGDRPYVGRWSR